MQWPKEKNKQWSTKHSQKTNYWATETPQKTESGEEGGVLVNSCATEGSAAPSPQVDVKVLYLRQERTIDTMAMCNLYDVNV